MTRKTMTRAWPPSKRLEIPARPMNGVRLEGFDGDPSLWPFTLLAILAVLVIALAWWVWS